MAVTSVISKVVTSSLPARKPTFRKIRATVTGGDLISERGYSDRTSVLTGKLVNVLFSGIIFLNMDNNQNRKDGRK